MSKPPSPSPAADVCLLLRADAEQSWLHREVLPVLRELEGGSSLTEDDSAAALAYLQAMWGEATIRARATDTAHGELRHGEEHGLQTLSRTARRYHASVRVLRELLAERVGSVTCAPGSEEGVFSAVSSTLAQASPGGEDCATRAA